jgi:hypothetical protein
MAFDFGGTIQIYLPAYDPSTGFITYTPYPVDWLLSSSGLQDNRVELILDYAWLNKANNDWRHFGDQSSLQVYGGLTGSGSIIQAQLNSAQVDITGGASLVDRWWGSSEIGKYGVISSGYNDIQNGLRFCNHPSTIHWFSNDHYPNQLNYSFPEGVIADISIFSDATYPLLYVDEGAGPFPVNFPTNSPN